MKQLLSAILATALLALTGCVSYSNHDLAPLEQWPLAAPAEVKPAAHLKVESRYLFNEQNRAGGFDQSNLETLLVQQFKDSGRFSAVTTAKEHSDVYVSVRVTNHERGSMVGAVVTGATFFIIPGRFKNELTMEMQFMGADGNVLGKVEKSESITTWMQLLLIFAVPFNESADNILVQLTRSSLEEAQRQKLI
ncbi:hypothetical protein DNK06_06510 [Pseudomonas daroniae]|uniref:Lipoprotein n=1 Tax=Phytopseudomonas daroniae TaxID=2487519 RepID=A0A4Q9QPT1_9GAMM|nr:MULTISPECIES: hypothetical protein [Pseudomonas]TBU82161.1 hypothetical protein DNK06_06510 [Pseudomonas daroniae]TBU84503.1 hypothetical protein DNK31_06005 [Pseudomonas sp. FRB 228]TBU92462.1 hypothetical protein DNJ99_08655 [Pseudomonas daroniae]